MDKSARFDKFVSIVVGAVLLYSAAMLVGAYYDGENLAAWVWERHQNQFSWYSRPVFLVPACYYAYRQNLGLIIGFMAMLFCSLFWFTAPVDVPPHVSGYLEWEKQLFFSDKSLVPGLVLVIVVAAFLVGLFSTFWHRNPWLGLLLINAGTAMKIVVSVVLGKESGYAAIVPSLTSLLIINVIGFVVWRFFKDRLDPENRP